MRRAKGGDAREGSMSAATAPVEPGAVARGFESSTTKTLRRKHNEEPKEGVYPD